MKRNKSSRNRAVAFGLSFLLATSATAAFAATPKPTLAEIAAAKKAEAAKKADADKAAAILDKANKTLRQLSAIAAAAQAKYVKAQNELAVAIKISNIAAEHYRLASLAVDSAHRIIGKLAANAYIMGSGFTDLDSLLHADGPQDLADRLNALDAVGQNNSTALDRFKSAEVVASSAQCAYGSSLTQARECFVHWQLQYRLLDDQHGELECDQGDHNHHASRST